MDILIGKRIPPSASGFPWCYVKKLEREAFEAAVVCICQEAEQEAAEYLKEALGLEARYKRRVALNAMLQTTGKKFTLDLGFSRGQVADFSVPKFAFLLFLRLEAG